MADAVQWLVTESGFEELDDFLVHLRDSSQDMTPALSDSRDHVQMMIRDEFATEGARSGGDWEPLTHKYALWKYGHGSYEILRLPPTLLHGDPGSPRDAEMYEVLLDDDSWIITPDDAFYNPDSSRAAWHQVGAIRKKGGVLPARPWLVFLEDDYTDILQIFEDWFSEIFLSPAFPGANVGRSSIGTFLPIGPYHPGG